MRPMRRVFERIWNWVRRCPTPFEVRWEQEAPERLARGVVYLIGEKEHLWCAAFTCPCGCGEAIQLSLLRDARPSWRVSEHANGTISISPSVWRTKGCRSHFFFRRGLIEWMDGMDTTAHYR
jgi:hypothetical protein